jgi:hypothetical protein
MEKACRDDLRILRIFFGDQVEGKSTIHAIANWIVLDGMA